MNTHTYPNDCTLVREVFFGASYSYHDFSSDLLRNAIDVKRNPAGGQQYVFTANAVTYIQGYIDRGAILMIYDRTYQPTPFTPEWCDTNLEGDVLDLTLGFKL